MSNECITLIATIVSAVAAIGACICSIITLVANCGRIRYFYKKTTFTYTIKNSDLDYEECVIEGEPADKTILDIELIIMNNSRTDYMINNPKLKIVTDNNEFVADIVDNDSIKIVQHGKISKAISLLTVQGKRSKEIKAHCVYNTAIKKDPNNKFYLTFIDNKGNEKKKEIKGNK